MGSITIGHVVISDHEDGITFGSLSEPGLEIKLRARGVSALLDFLRSSSVNPANRRQGFRIPLELADGLRATVDHNGRLLEAVVMDVGLSGIRIEPTDSSAPELEAGAKVDVTLRLGTASTTLRSEIRRRAGSGYGIVFLDALEGDEPAPPPEFAKMIAQLERRWLAEQVLQEGSAAA